MIFAMHIAVDHDIVQAEDIGHIAGIIPLKGVRGQVIVCIGGILQRHNLINKLLTRRHTDRLHCSILTENHLLTHRLLTVEVLPLIKVDIQKGTDLGIKFHQSRNKLGFLRCCHK